MIVCPLFPAEDDGLIPISPLQLEVITIDPVVAQRLNKTWHSVLPTTFLGNIVGARLAVCYAAVYKNKYYAVAIWTTPIAANRMIGGFDKAELRRLAIGPEAPKNTATRMMAVMRRLLTKSYPWLSGLVSYQAEEHHSGTIYKAAGWKITGASDTKKWHEGESRGDFQTKSRKIRWELGFEGVSESNYQASFETKQTAKSKIVKRSLFDD